MKRLTWRSEYSIMYLIFDQISNLEITLTHGGCDDSKMYRKLAKGGQQITGLPIVRTVKNVLVENLRDEIIRGDIVPGQRLRLEELATRYDVSTMPVREALRDLETEGLVTIFPHRGAVVTRLSADDLQDIYDIRATLEEMATRLAVPRVTRATLTKLTSLVRQIDGSLGDIVTLVKMNHQFHSTLYAASGRSHLCELTSMLRYRTQHYLHAYVIHSGGMDQAQVEHRAILEACKHGDAERAGIIVHDHVAQVGHAIVEYVRERDDTGEPIEENLFE